MRRYGLSDSLWERVKEDFLPGREDHVGGAVATTVFSWKRCCGLCTLAVHGVICLPCSATGARRSVASATGVLLMFSNGFSMHYPVIRIWNMQRS